MRKLWQRIAKSLRRRWLSFLLAFVSGVLYFVGFCGLDQYYLAWFCLVPVLWALDDETLSFKETLAIAWFFGLVTHMGGYTWIVGMLLKFAYLPLPLALLGYFLLCFAQGSLLAFWGVVVQRLRTKLGVSFVWSVPVVMAVAEWLYPALFPSYLSNSQYEQILFIQSLDIWGPLGLTFILTLCSAVIYEILAARYRRRGRPPRLALVVLLLLVVASVLYGYGASTNIDDSVAHAGRRVKVGVVQANMGIYQKDKDPQEGWRRHLEQSREVERQGAELIVWPESGYGFPIAHDAENVKRAVMADLSTPLIFGAIRVEYTEQRERKIYNTAIATDGAGNVLGTYDKIFLLAFGEYLPLGDIFPQLYELSPHTSFFERGSHTKPLTIDGVDYGMLICYEDILPGLVRKVMAYEPDVLVNITNDAWFGETREPTIHLAMAAFRAVEQRRFLVRSTNTGISAIVDPAGRITHKTPVFARANIVAEVAPLSGITIYQHLGDWVGVVALLVLLVWLRGPIKGLGRRLTGRSRKS